MPHIRRILSAAAAATLLVTALAVPASAHGGRHGACRAAAQPANIYCSYCEEYHTAGTHCDDCDYTARNQHGGHGGGHGRCRA